MRVSSRIQAVSVIQWAIIEFVAILGVVILFCEGITITRTNRLLLVIIFIIVTPVSCYHFTHATYMTDKGIECYRFGKKYRSIFWHQIEMACIISDYPFSNFTSGTTRILLIPKGCAKYDKGVWVGIAYLYTLRNVIFWVDNTKTNREFIELQYGKIADRT